MADLYTHPKQSDFLKSRYLWELWKALLEHAPTVIAFLREHGPEDWLARYSLPDGLLPFAQDYHSDPDGYVLMGWDWGDSPPRTTRLVWFFEPLPDYDPATMPAGRWRERAIAWLDAYIQTVEDAYREAGWQKTRVKYNPQHFVWLALKLEGLSYKQIAEKLELKADDTAVRMAVMRLGEQLGVNICIHLKCSS